MTVQPQLVDTNVLVRFFTGDPPNLAAKARRLVQEADNGEVLLVILPVIVAETIYTLESFYEMERKEVASLHSCNLVGSRRRSRPASWTP
jgi:predicted nucleic acid-binding protein